MKKIYLITIAFCLLLLGIYIFFHKTQLEFELVCTSNNETEFYPDAHRFIHSEKAFKRYINININTHEFGKQCYQPLDFKKYSYVIVYGRKPKSMYYSYKSTWFDDISPSYARPWGSKVVFIEYEDKSKGIGTFIYRVKRQEELRGFFGV